MSLAQPRSAKGAVVALLTLMLVRLWLASSLPLAPDESYYYLWAQHLQAGYFDHPPMVALWIKAGTMLCGNTPLGIRLLGPVFAAAGSVLLWDAAEQLAPGRGIIAVLVLNATLMVGAGALIMTPDTPLLFFWTAGLAALARLITSGNPRWWLAVGLAAGGMLLSKYTAGLFVIAVFLWLLCTVSGRRVLCTPWPWLAMALAFAIFAPNIAWNAAHGWASYMKQGGREAAFAPARAAAFFAELVAGQLALATPGIAALAAFGVWQLRLQASPGTRLLLWLTLVPGVVMLEHILSDRVQENWVAIIYPSACLAAAMLPAALLARWLKPALALGFGITALAYVQAADALLPLPANLDTAGEQLSGWQNLAQDAMASHPAFITTDDYATMATLAVQGPKDVKVAGFTADWDRRWRYFGYPPAVAPGSVGVMLTKRRDTPCKDVLGTLTRHRGTEVFATYKLCRFVAPNAGVLLPRP